MSLFTPVHLESWIEHHRSQLKPPVGNKAIWRDERETIVMIVGGPNARNDYHVNATEEFFLQIKGDMSLPIIHPDGRRETIIIREGEVYLLPANIPHSPRRPAGTIGLVLELKRPEGAVDTLQWYCDACDRLVFEKVFALENIAVDLKTIMEKFWSDESLRTCSHCGAVVQHPGESQPPPPAKR